jgi:hypothetical protein
LVKEKRVIQGEAKDLLLACGQKKKQIPRFALDDTRWEIQRCALDDAHGQILRISEMTPAASAARAIQERF